LKPFILISLLSVLMLSCDLAETQKQTRSFEDKEREIYIINSNAETVSVFHPDTQILYSDVILTGDAPNDIVYFDNRLFIVNSLGNTIQVLNENTFAAITEIYLGKNKNPWTIIIDESEHRGYIPNFVADTVMVIDLDSYEILDEFSVGKGPEGGFYYNGKVVVCNTNFQGGSTYGEGSLSIIDTSDLSVTDVVINSSKGLNPQSAFYLSDSDEIHVALTGTYTAGNGAAIVFDGTTYSEKSLLSLGGSPVFGRDNIDTGSLTVYVSGYSGLMSYNYSSKTILHDNSDYVLEDFCSGLAVDEVNSFILVTLFDKDSLALVSLNDNTLLKEITASDGPQTPRLITE